MLSLSLNTNDSEEKIRSLSNNGGHASPADVEMGCPTKYQLKEKCVLQPSFNLDYCY